MAKEPSIPVLTTYSALMFQHWPEITKVICELSHSVESTSISQTTAAMLSNVQLQTALNSPYQIWLAEILCYYNKLAQWSLQVNLNKDKKLKEALLKQGLTEDDICPQTLPQKLSKTQVEGLTKKLEQLALEQYSSWKTFYHHWVVKLIETMQKNQVSFNEDEAHKMLKQDFIADLVANANQLKLTLSKDIREAKDCSQYLQVKLIIALHVALLRLNQAASMGAINKHTKKLKNFFYLMDKEQQEFVKLNQSALEQVFPS